MDARGDGLVDLLAEAALTGRGGGHFPAAAKWRTVRATTRRTGVLPIVVANAAEGEPASAKDAALLARRPHLVLDGLADAAEAVAATEAVIWLHDSAHELNRVVVHALQERRAAGGGRTADAARHRAEHLCQRRVQRSGPRTVRRPGAARVPAGVRRP